MRRKKYLVSSNFQEIFNWKKAIKNKNKNQTNTFCLLFIVFFTQSSQYQIWKANTYSILTVIELGPPVSESSTRISKIYDPPNSEQKFYKTRIENWLSIGFKLGFPWLRTYSYNHYTMHNMWHKVGMMGSLKLSYTHLQVLEQSGDLSLPLNCANALKIHTQLPEWPQTPTKTNHHLLNHLQTLHTN